MISKMQSSCLQKKMEKNKIYICVVVSAFGTTSKMFMKLVVIIVLWSFYNIW